MCSIALNFISKTVINGNSEACYAINVVHYLLKLFTMSPFSYTGLWIREKKICVNHLVQYGLFQFIRSSIFEQGLRKFDRTRATSFVFAGAST